MKINKAILCILIGVVFFIFFLFQESNFTFVKGEFQRICTATTHSTSEYNKCFQPYWDEDTTLRFATIFSISLGVAILFLRAIRVRKILVAFLVVILILLFFLARFIYQEVKVFTDNSHLSITKVLQTVKAGLGEKLTTQNGNGVVTFLILGTNKLKTRYFLTEITDTMLLVSINTKTGRVGLFSIPRDTWSAEYQTKIDALYTYGNDRFPGFPEKFPTQYIQDLTGIKIDHTIVLSPDAFGSVIDAMGGVQVDVKTAFTDNQFPDPNVDILTVHDPAKLYLTVTFQTGLQQMDSVRALEYVRSRHASGEEGSDIARSRRQRQVIMSLVQEMEKPNFYTNVGRLGKLYAIYNENFAKYLSISQLITLGKAIYSVRNKIQFVDGGPSIYPDVSYGSIFHPQDSPLNDGQWVFTIRDKTQFQKEVHDTLAI